MAINILTKEDLQEFKREIFEKLEQLKPTEPTQARRWLRSYEVRKLLNISTGTLQTMRINDTLHPKKVGGIHFYDYEEICKLLQKPNKKR